MVLPTSIAEPPPSATTALTRSARASAAAASTCAIVGSLLMSVNATTPKPPAASDAARGVDEAALPEAGIGGEHDRAAARYPAAQGLAERLEGAGALDDLWDPCKRNGAHGFLGGATRRWRGVGAGGGHDATAPWTAGVVPASDPRGTGPAPPASGRGP